MACKILQNFGIIPDEILRYELHGSAEQASENNQKRPPQASSYYRSHAIIKYSVAQMAIQTDSASRHAR